EDAGRARAARAARPAIAARVLGEILLVVLLGVVELGRVDDLGGDATVARLREHALIGVARGLRKPPLLGRIDVDPRTVLRADVVALAHALRRVMALPEDPQKRRVAHARGVEDDAHDLGVAGEAAAELIVVGVRSVASRVADRSRDDARLLPTHPP